MVELEFQQKTKTLIDSLKSICANYGLGNDGNEFKIITQTFLYKFLNDKFAFEAKKLDDTIAKAEKWEEALVAMSEDDLDMLQLQMGGDTDRLEEHAQRCGLFPWRFPADGSFKKLLNASVLFAVGVLAPVVSAASSASVGTLYPTGHTELPSVFNHLALLRLPSLSTPSATQS